MSKIQFVCFRGGWWWGHGGKMERSGTGTAVLTHTSRWSSWCDVPPSKSLQLKENHCLSPFKNNTLLIGVLLHSWKGYNKANSQPSCCFPFCDSSQFSWSLLMFKELSFEVEVGLSTFPGLNFCWFGNNALTMSPEFSVKKVIITLQSVEQLPVTYPLWQANLNKIQTGKGSKNE